MKVQSENWSWKNKKNKETIILLSAKNTIGERDDKQNREFGIIFILFSCKNVYSIFCVSPPQLLQISKNRIHDIR